MSPQTLPFTIGLGYAAMIWGFGSVTLSANMAKDMGCRIVAAIFFGSKAFTFRHYAWISVLVNIPASLFATGVYELFLRDSLAMIGSGAGDFEHGADALAQYLVEAGLMEKARSPTSAPRQNTETAQQVEVLDNSVDKE